MGRGRSSFGGSSGGSRGSSNWGGFSSRGRSSMRSSHRHTTLIIGGGRSSYSGSGEGGGNGTTVGIIVGAFFALFGMIILLLGIYECSQVCQYGKTSAYCVGNEYSHGWYYALYDYNVDGKEYDAIRSNQGWEFKEEVGEKVTIYYLKSDPAEISEDCPAKIGTGIGEIAFSLIFGGMGVLAMVICIRQSKRAKVVDSPKVEEIENVEESTEKVCSYCGSKYDKSLNSCPKCGASK